MKRKLSRLISPNPFFYLLVLGIFIFLTIVWPWNTLVLAVAELLIAAALAIYAFVDRASRKKALALFAQQNEAALQEHTQSEFPFASVLVQVNDQKILWANDSFRQITELPSSMLPQYLTDVIPDFTLEWLTDGDMQAQEEPILGGRCYRVFGNWAHGDGSTSQPLAVLYFMELTELLKLKEEYFRSRPIVSVILVDNYDELTGTMSDAAISTLNASIYNCITAWTDEIGGMLRKLERNRYLFIMEAGDLPRAIDGKFALLESIRHITNPVGIGATISMGLGKDGANIQEDYQFAILSLEMALSRGGNQVVIKDRYDFTFFGGRAKENQSHTAVRIRTLANSLSGLISQSSSVFIMGHKNADLDAVGAAAGVACLCRKLEKPFKIVIDLEHNAAGTLLSSLQQLPEYEGCFISDQDALILADARSLLVVVDTNRPNQVESPGLLESVSKVCVIDHHRRAADYIKKPIMALHEPSASSASELVSEVLQYAIDPASILVAEANALLAGIVLDTKNFSVRTSEHTFDVAAFLRRLGADTVTVKKLFKVDLQSTLTRYQIIQAARLYRNNIAIAALDYTTSRTIAAQAADELLNISGIETSFVLYPQNEQIIISARSIGDANVQAILEPMGGGGNGATAGAQVRSLTLRQALEKLVACIDNYYKETEGSL